MEPPPPVPNPPVLGDPKIPVPDDEFDFVKGSLKLFIEDLKKKEPESYERAQRNGEELMNHHLEDVRIPGYDKDEAAIRGKEVVALMEYYGLEESELTDSQKRALMDYRNLKKEGI